MFLTLFLYHVMCLKMLYMKFGVFLLFFWGVMAPAMSRKMQQYSSLCCLATNQPITVPMQLTGKCMTTYYLFLSQFWNSCWRTFLIILLHGYNYIINFNYTKKLETFIVCGQRYAPSKMSENPDNCMLYAVKHTRFWKGSWRTFLIILLHMYDYIINFNYAKNWKVLSSVAKDMPTSKSVKPLIFAFIYVTPPLIANAAITDGRAHIETSPLLF